MNASNIEQQTSDETLYRLAELFKVFGDPTRIRILHSLAMGELCVQDIADKLSMTQSAISHQLRILKQMALVKFRREGKTIYYSLADDHVKTIYGPRAGTCMRMRKDPSPPQCDPPRVFLWYRRYGFLCHKKPGVYRRASSWVISSQLTSFSAIRTITWYRKSAISYLISSLSGFFAAITISVHSSPTFFKILSIPLSNR